MAAPNPRKSRWHIGCYTTRMDTRVIASRSATATAWTIVLGLGLALSCGCSIGAAAAGAADGAVTESGAAVENANPADGGAGSIEASSGLPTTPDGAVRESGPVPDAAHAADAASTPDAAHAADAAATHDASPSPSNADAEPLPSAFAGLTPGSSNGTWGVDAPDDTDQAAWVASGETLGGSNGTRGYGEKGYSFIPTNIDQLPTISDSANDSGSAVRFGYTTLGGLPAVLRSIHQGDPLYWKGNRSGLSYDGFQISHGVDYWFAFAVQFGPEWVHESCGGNDDRQAIWDTHSVAESPGFNGTLAEISWNGGVAGAYTGKELWLAVPQYGSGNVANLYNWAANPGGWQRLIMHYRSGSTAQGPVMDLWVANGAGAFAQLPKAIDPYTGTPWTVTPAWGDPLTNTLPQFDWMKVEIYKWTSTVYGSIPIRNVWMSDIFAGKGVALYDNAVAALAAYAK